ncbi:MAG TPA: ABC transporter ATP-binding protein [Synergistaceae bacterium]|nr:ABC transporter ATP-binding protein [Synergistaceae bacterium]
MALLEVKNVTKRFGALLANDDVSFSVEEGSIVGLIGPNGAGKTTLFNCVSGAYAPSEGEIFFEKTNVAGFSPHRICQMGLVRTFQVVKPLRGMTVLENVMVGAFCRTQDTRKAREIAEEVISLCELEHRREANASSLTIGDKKRLEVARALATRPRILLLDEVMAGLTTSEVNHAVQLMLKLRERGVTLLMVEHIMEAIMPIADRVVVLDGGCKIAEDSPDRVVKNERVIEAYLGKKYAERQKKMEERKEGASHA